MKKTKNTTKKELKLSYSLPLPINNYVLVDKIDNPFEEVADDKSKVIIVNNSDASDLACGIVISLDLEGHAARKSIAEGSLIWFLEEDYIRYRNEEGLVLLDDIILVHQLLDPEDER